MYDIHFKTLVLKMKPKRTTAGRTDVSESILKDFNIWLIFSAAAPDQICESLEKSP